MTTLTGDKCSKCGYAFEVFDRACRRCYASGARTPHVARASGWISQAALGLTGHLLLWIAVVFVAASVSCAWVLCAAGGL